MYRTPEYPGAPNQNEPKNNHWFRWPLAVPCPWGPEGVATHVVHMSLSFQKEGARCSSVVRAFAHGAMGRRVDPSWSGPIELFLVSASAPRLVQQRPWYVLSCLWDGAYKRNLAVNQKE